MATPLTLAQMRTQVKERLRDQSGSGLTDAQYTLYIQDAVENLYIHTYEVGKAALTPTVVDYVWPADQLSVLLSAASVFNVEDVDLLLVQQFPRNEAESATNRPFSIEATAFEYGAGVGRVATSPQYLSTDGSVIALWDGFAVGQFRYSLQGQSMAVWPTPRVAVKLRLHGLVPWTKPTADGDDCVPDMFARWQRLVMFDAAIQMMENREQDASGMMRQRAELMQQYDGWLAKREQPLLPPSVIQHGH